MLEIGWSNKNKSKGFTLIEILVVLFIIGISATLVVVNLSSVNSIEKRADSIEDSIKFLAEESIITGNIIAWYFDSKKTMQPMFMKMEMKNKLIIQETQYGKTHRL